MLGRKQSIKADNIADYGNEEMLNESADEPLFNKVNMPSKIVFTVNLTFIFIAMDSKIDAAVCSSFAILSMPKYAKNL